jgi:hypothetical protein
MDAMIYLEQHREGYGERFESEVDSIPWLHEFETIDQALGA